MGLSDAVARAATRHAHVLVVEVPGHWRTRAAVERQVLARGWKPAVSPADADVLAVCGDAGPQLDGAVDLVWHQMSGPRVRLAVGEYDDVDARLDEALAGLLDTDHHRHDARHRPKAPDLIAARADHADKDHGGMGHGDMDHGDMDHGDMDHGGMDHGGMDHGGMDHGGMDMAPDGIPLAGGGEDRDGLEMDVLHLPLGPVLPHWPAGLVLRCSLQGDVIVEADAELLDQEAGHERAESASAARRCDNLAALLALAGWDDAAADARGLRDRLLSRHDPNGVGPFQEDAHSAAGDMAAGDIAARAAALRRKVRRSRLLRWSLRGIRPLDVETLEHHGLPAHAAGDTYDRLLRMLERVHSELAGEHGGDPGHGQTSDHSPHSTSLPAHQVAHLATGLDLATARLVVASLDIHHLHAEPAAHGAAHA